MMPMRGVATAATLVLLACPAWVRGLDDPPLGTIAERAKRERGEQRAKTSAPVKTFTDADLKGQGAPEPPREAPSAGKTAAGPASGDHGPDGQAATQEKTDDQIRGEKRAEIQKGIDAQRLKLRQVDQGMADAKAELTDLTNYTYAARKDALQRTIDDGQEEKARAQRAMDGLQEEARRLGVPVS
jgi:hypothetical protein